MTQLNMTHISREIDTVVPEGFRVEQIRINLDCITPDIREEEWPEIVDQFERIASNHLSSDLRVTQDSSLPKLWTYDLVHTCGREPMYDEQANEYYCPICADSVFDY